MQTSQTNITFVFDSESLNNVLYFTGKEWEQETGTYYFGARRYDPTIGQWLGIDPARQFESPYVYAGNGVNPLTFLDSDGLWGVALSYVRSAASGSRVESYSFDVRFNRDDSKSVFDISSYSFDVTKTEIIGDNKFKNSNNKVTTGEKGYNGVGISFSANNGNNTTDALNKSIVSGTSFGLVEGFGYEDSKGLDDSGQENGFIEKTISINPLPGASFGNVDYSNVEAETTSLFVDKSKD